MAQDLLYFLPQWILIGTIIVLFFCDFFIGIKKQGIYPLVAAAGIVGMMIANGSIASLASKHLFSGMITFDAMGHFFHYLFGAAGLFGIFLSWKSPEVEKTDQTSYFTLLVALVLGMMLLSTSNHLLMLYLSLEMVSVLSYILTGYLRGVRRSTEASLKYVIYGGVASAIMVYGISLLYGLTGSLSFPEIASFIKTHAVDRPVLFTSVLMMMAGLGFKVAAVPFHFWCPDVYEGAPTPFTAFLSVGPKAAGVAILLRFFFVGLSQKTPEGFVLVKTTGWVEMMTILSIATMTVGNLAALVQTNMKRLLAYSSIAHAGYLLMGVAALNQEALTATLFYLVVYLIMNMGAFLVVIIIANQLGTEEVNGYRGLGRRGGQGTLLALSMAVFLFSLTGIPPMAGFIGKFYLFGAVIRSGLYGLAIVGVLNSVVSLYYYVRIVKLMFFDAPADHAPKITTAPSLAHSWVVSGLALLTLTLGLFWDGLAGIVSRSAGLFF